MTVCNLRSPRPSRPANSSDPARPAFIAAIGLYRPGRNFATNIQAGLRPIQHQLLWVVVWANLMAMLVQTLSAKLGIVTGKNLAEHIRDRRGPQSGPCGYQAGIIAMATDLAEFIGAAVNFKLLLGITLLEGPSPPWSPGGSDASIPRQAALEFVVGACCCSWPPPRADLRAPTCRVCWSLWPPQW